MIVIIVIIKQLFSLQRTSLSLFLIETSLSRSHTHARIHTCSLSRSLTLSLFLSRSSYIVHSSIDAHTLFSFFFFFFPFRSYLISFLSFYTTNVSFFFFFIFLFSLFNSLFWGAQGVRQASHNIFFFSRVYLFHERDTGTIVRSFFSFFFFFNFLRLRVFNTVYSRGVNALTRWRAHPTSARLSCSPFSKLILDIISSCRLILSSYTFISGMYI